MVWNGGVLARIVLKAAALFAIINAIFALTQPVPLIGRISLHNVVYPGRARLPYGDNPALSYNLSPSDLNTMFASHAIARPKAGDEFRVVLIGDSSVWGFLLKPEETLAARLDALELHARDGRRMRFYNLGYPIMSLTKDVLILDEALRQGADMAIWLLTMESFAADAQAKHPLVRYNVARVMQLKQQAGLPINVSELAQLSLWERTLIGQRRALADWLRLQLYGVLWAATGIDQHYPETYTPAQRDLSSDLSWHAHLPPHLPEEALAFGVLAAGVRLTRERNAALLLVNEPILISSGANSHLRYNAFYPRWAYDAYRARLRAWANDQRVPLLDAWDAVPQTEFTDSAVHLTPHGVHLLAEQIGFVLRTQP
ncbi:MAG: hypothetical protein NZ532_07975 [Thermoflexales bacterium]|nr:hypothetical protein [Thermoflexales bacterium]